MLVGIRVVGAVAARRVPVIYALCVIADDLRVLYVGQTNQVGGVLGRLGQHLSEAGTFRSRVENILGLRLADTDCVWCVAVPLPQTRRFESRASDGREAVEHLVEESLRRGVCQEFQLVSVGRTTPKPSDVLEDVRGIAAEVTQQISESISSHCNGR